MFYLVPSLTQVILMLFAILTYFPFVQFPAVQLASGDSSRIRQLEPGRSAAAGGQYLAPICPGPLVQPAEHLPMVLQGMEWEDGSELQQMPHTNWLSWPRVKILNLIAFPLLSSHILSCLPPETDFFFFLIWKRKSIPTFTQEVDFYS